MKYGRLRHVVAVQSAEDTIASDGSTTTTYTTVGSVRADLLVLVDKGSEDVQERETAGETRYKVDMRHEPAINGSLTRKHRLLVDGDTINSGGADFVLDIIEPGFVDHRRKLVTSICVRRDR